MGPKLYNAVRFYRDGVADGHLDVALDKYVSVDLVQHHPDRPDGHQGLAERFGPLVGRHQRRHAQPLRGFQDGSTVVLHSLLLFGHREVEQVAIDIFDTDDSDRLTGHWGAVVPLATSSRSGYSQLDGPTVAEDVDQSADNKRLVAGYLRDCLIGDRADALERYLDPVVFAQHDPDLPGGIAGLRWALEQPDRRRCLRVERLVGYGSLVATAGWYADPAGRYLGCELFRVAGGRIVDQWRAHERLT